MKNIPQFCVWRNINRHSNKSTCFPSALYMHGHQQWMFMYIQKEKVVYVFEAKSNLGSFEPFSIDILRWIVQTHLTYCISLAGVISVFLYKYFGLSIDDDTVATMTNQNLPLIHCRWNRYILKKILQHKANFVVKVSSLI